VIDVPWSSAAPAIRARTASSCICRPTAPPTYGAACSRSGARTGSRPPASARGTHSGSRWGTRSMATTSTIAARRSRRVSAGSRSSTRATSSGATHCSNRRQEGVRERLVGFVCQERGFPRHGYTVQIGWRAGRRGDERDREPDAPDRESAWLRPVESREAGTRIDIMVRDRAIPAEVTRPPFYTEGSVRR
jgi:hypothetical protein